MNAPMRIINSLTELQRQQQTHDFSSHWDIVCLPAPDRLKHMVLHFSKYVGRLAASPHDLLLFQSTVIDTFIIALATANALNVDLGTKCPIPQEDNERREIPGTRDRFFLSLAAATGQMAKACEALDHIERFNSRQELETGVITICNSCLQAAAEARIPLGEGVPMRWKEVESR